MSTANLDALIYDRTNDDVTNDTDKAYIAYTDLNRIENACLELADLLNVERSKLVTKTWVMSDYRTETDMARIRNNIQILVDAYYKVPGMAELPDEIKYTNVFQANTVEKCIHDIYVLYQHVMISVPRVKFTLGRRLLGNR